MKAAEKDAMPSPAKISFFHFMDESFHFNSSMVISKDVVNSLPDPTRAESIVANVALLGCQKDHYNFSTAINGIFWHDPAVLPAIEKVLRSKHFGLNEKDARELMRKSFCEENEGMLASQKTHSTALDSYKQYLADMKYVWKANKEMSVMGKNNLAAHLETNRRAFRAWS
jgi:hypothetical protein